MTGPGLMHDQSGECVSLTIMHDNQTTHQTIPNGHNIKIHGKNSYHDLASIFG